MRWHPRMRTAVLVSLALLATALALPAAEAGPNTFPVCHDRDVNGILVKVHVGLDCEPGVWVDVCPPGASTCQRYEAALA